MSGPNPPGPDSPAPDEPAREAPSTGETEIYSQAYSAPESEHFTSGPYVPADAALYDYDDYDRPAAAGTTAGAGARAAAVVDPEPPRWPWVVGVVEIGRAHV